MEVQDRRKQGIQEKATVKRSDDESVDSSWNVRSSVGMGVSGRVTRVLLDILPGDEVEETASG